MKAFRTANGEHNASGWATSVALAAFLITIGTGGNALAAQCMGDAAGDPSLNCTANDLGVASVTVTNVTDDGCAFVGDSFTFDGTLNLDANTTTRYDLGFYIGADSQQALTGTCAVALIPPVGAEQIDGDSCGDSPKDTALNVPVSGVTAVCNDANGDGFFDLAICASYDNNNQDNCTGTSQLIPSTSAKCQCAQIPTNVTVPRCTSNAECVTDNNICTDEVCHPAVGSGGDSFGCSHDPNTASCDDGLFCNGADICSAGSCGHAGDPCLGGGVCGNVCNEGADNCFVTAGTTCRVANGVCDVAETCTGSTADCPANGFSSGNTCRAANGVCDVAETCSGTSANCPADGFLSGNTCRADAGDCDVAETCSGTSPNCPANSGDPAGTPCSSDSNVCTDDVCDGSGTCNHNNNSDPCDDGLFCTVSDVCSAGQCSGASRDCADAVACTDDSCNEASNECENTPVNSNCDDQDSCTTDVCSEISGCINTQTCGAVICRSPGYWATHSGYEKVKQSSINVGQLVIDAAGPLEVCGQSISTTSNPDSPFLDGLGLTSDLEGLCMRAKGVHQRQLYRQLVAAALNCGITGGDCDGVIEPFAGVKFSDCSNLCAGDPPVIDPPTVGECIAGLDCFNNGGHMVGGSCATGTCEIDPSIACGGDHGSCESGACIPYEDNCHDAALCNEALGVCPKKTPASSPAACREARFDECTIDSCN